MRARKQNSLRRGFTLLEIVLAITLMTVLAASMTPFLYRTLSSSAAPMFEYQKTLQLGTDMEAINQDYKTNYVSDLETLRTRINAKVYGSGTYTIVYNNYIRFTDDDGDAVTVGDEGDNNGQWRLINDSTGTNNVLYVTIANSSGTRLTRLFVKQ